MLIFALISTIFLIFSSSDHHSYACISWNTSLAAKGVYADRHNKCHSFCCPCLHCRGEEQEKLCKHSDLQNCSASYFLIFTITSCILTNFVVYPAIGHCNFTFHSYLVRLMSEHFPLQFTKKEVVFQFCQNNVELPQCSLSPSIGLDDRQARSCRKG